MQNTVYSLVCEYTKTNPHFKFHPAGIHLIGQFVAREWRQKGGTMSQLDVVQSVEPHGTFMVFSYPDSFVTNIYSIIQRYVNMCLAPKKPKVITEKPKTKTTKSVHPISSSLPHKRKRKPLLNNQPEFSGKKLIKGK